MPCVPESRQVRRAGFLADLAWNELRTHGPQALASVQPRYAR